MEVRSDVNRIEEVVSLLKEENGYLNLSDRFADVFASLEGRLHGVDNIKLIVLSTAGFTDTRIVYLWLKGEEIFNGKELVMYKAEPDTELAEYQDFEKFFTSHKRVSQLEYSKEASVG